MPKPTREQVVEAVYGKVTGSDLVDAVLDLIGTAWDGDIRVAFNLLRDYGRHHGWCPALVLVGEKCRCGFGDAWDAMEAQTAAPDTAQATPEPTLPPEPDDLERFNQEQRLRREGFEAALTPRALNPLGRRRAAAKRYPLKKRVPDAIPDPSAAGIFWRVRGGYIEWREGNDPWRLTSNSATPGITPNRILDLAALLANPFKVIDDIEPEEGT